MPLGGLAIAIFAGWARTRASVVDELGIGEGLRFRLWYLLVRFISPVALVIMFLHSLGVI